MRYLIRILGLCVLALIPFLACMDFGEPPEGCGSYDWDWDGSNGSDGPSGPGPWPGPGPGPYVPPTPNTCQGVVCPDDGNECTEEYCSGGVCRSTPVPNGTRCDFDSSGAGGFGGSGGAGGFGGSGGVADDGVCVNGVCGENLCKDVVCDDHETCTRDACDYVDGTCDFSPLPKGTPCELDGLTGTCIVGGVCAVQDCQGVSDGVACSIAEGSEQGACFADECRTLCETVEDCDDRADCTADACTPLDGNGVCVYTAVADGTPCAGGTCEAGVCELTDTVLPCTEQGIRNAIAAGGDEPYTFNCNGPTTVWTEAEIRINNNVILDGEGNLTIDANRMHRVFSVVSDTTVELRGMTVTGGARGSWGGGGIRNDIDATLTLTNSTVSGNTADKYAYGGGIYNLGALTLTNSTVSGNTAGNKGGGIYSSGTLTVTGSTVSGNTDGTVSGSLTDTAGGGIYNAGTATLTDTTVSGNVAKYGGGIHNGHATMTVTNSTVSGNRARFAAGLYNWGTLTLTNSTVSGTEPYHTIYNTDALTVTNTVFVGLCSGPSGVVTSTSGGYNIESPGDTCRFDQPTDVTEVTAAELNLGPLAENGGPTKTHALEPGSPAIDLIPEAGCVVDTDQRGEPRPETGGTMCDVGAFEVQP